MLICEMNNQRGYRGASNYAVQVHTWEQAEAVLKEKFPGRNVEGATAKDRVEALRQLLNRTCAVTFHILAEQRELARGPAT